MRGKNLAVLVTIISGEIVVWIVAVVLIRKYEVVSGSVFRGVPTTSLYIATTMALATAVGLTLAFLTSIRKLRWQPIARAGTFPSYLPAVRMMIAKAKPKSEFLIAVDGPEHGSLARFEEHDRLVEEIKRAVRRRVKVKLLLLGANARVSRANPNWDFEKEFGRFRKTVGFTEFFRRYWPGLPEPRTAAEFSPQIDDYMNRVLRELMDAGVVVRRLSDDALPEVQRFMWISTGRSLVVLLANDSRKPAPAHVTSEAVLVHRDRADFIRLWERAADVRPPQASNSPVEESCPIADSSATKSGCELSSFSSDANERTNPELRSMENCELVESEGRSA